jgi:hypothetical protein
MKAPYIAIAAALLATGGSAAAQSATDARCIVLSSAFANQSKDATQRKLAEDSLYFYLGRIDGQPTTAQFKAALDAQSKMLTDATAGNLMGECVKAVRARVELLQTLAAPQPKPKPPANPQGR